MGFLDGLAGFLESFVNFADKNAEKKLNDYNNGKGNLTTDQLTGISDYMVKRAGQKSCARCGGAVASDTSDYCQKCRKELGLN